MENIWFLRTDKDNFHKKYDISENNKFIYSGHGICGTNINIEKHKKHIFPSLSIESKKLRPLIISIKNELISKGKFNINDLSKQKCDLFIWYWIVKMSDGDIVFVRNKKQEVFMCRITGYITENWFNEHRCFQRPVEILQQISSKTVPIKIWDRTLGRKTIEINDNKNVRTLVYRYLKDINSFET